MVVKLKDPHLLPHKEQYPLKPEVEEGLTAPILGIKKSNDK